MDAFTKRAWSKGAQDPAKPAIGAAKKGDHGHPTNHSRSDEGTEPESDADA